MRKQLREVKPLVQVTASVLGTASGLAGRCHLRLRQVNVSVGFGAIGWVHSGSDVSAVQASKSHSLSLETNQEETE